MLTHASRLAPIRLPKVNGAEPPAHASAIPVPRDHERERPKSSKRAVPPNRSTSNACGRVDRCARRLLLLAQCLPNPRRSLVFDAQPLGYALGAVPRPAGAQAVQEAGSVNQGASRVPVASPLLAHPRELPLEWEVSILPVDALGVQEIAVPARPGWPRRVHWFAANRAALVSALFG